MIHLILELPSSNSTMRSSDGSDHALYAQMFKLMAAYPNPEILNTICSFVNTSAAVDVNSTAAGN